MHNVRLTHSAEAELSAIQAGPEKEEVKEALLSLEESPFHFGVVKLIPEDAYAQLCGGYYIAYVVTGDDVIVCSVRRQPIAFR